MRLLVSTGRGARLFTPEHPKGTGLSVGALVRSRFSSRGDMLATVDEKGEMTLFSLPDGRFYQSFHGVRDVAFLDANTIVIRKNCRFERIDLRAPSNTRVGTERCGEAAFDRQARFALVYELGHHRYGANRTYKRIAKIDLATGAESIVFDGGDDNPIMAPRLSPAGDRVCFVLGRAHEWRFACQRWGEAMQKFAANTLRQYRFNDTGNLVLVGIGPQRHRPKKLQLIDLATATRYDLFTTDQLYWSFWGTSRVLTWGKKGAEIYDLHSGWHAYVSRSGEWGGFRSLDDDRFVMGKERRATRDLYEFSLPAGL